MKLLLMLTCLYLAHLPKGESSLGKIPDGWELVSQFSKGNLYKSSSSDKITLSSFREDGHVFIYNKLFNVHTYLKGLKEVRDTTYGIGGLKNWKLNRLLSFEKKGLALIVTFESQYERADDTVVQMYERHIFNKTQFYQWQIITNKHQSQVKDEMAVKTFEGLTREVVL